MLSGRQKRSDASLTTWKMEFSIGGAVELGSGLRYNAGGEGQPEKV